MKEAGWTLRPTTELEIAQERRQIRLRKRTGWVFFLASLGLCPFSCLSLGGLGTGGSGAMLALAVTLFVAVWGAYGHRSRRTREIIAARLQFLHDEYADLQGWLVEIVVLQGAAPTGSDRGVLWFEEDRLMFVGERTSFALGPAAVAQGPRDHWGVSRLLPTTTLPLHASSPVGKVALGFTVFTDYDPNRVHRGTRGLQAALRGWAATSGSDEGQGPPLALGECPAVGDLLRGALGISLVWSLLGAVAAAFAATEEYGIMAVVTGGVLIAFLATPDLWSFRLRWRAWRDRRRLGRLGSFR